MNSVLRLAIVDPRDQERESVKTMLLGMESVWLEAECSRYEFFNDVVAQTSPDLGIIALDKDLEKALELIGKLRTHAPQCKVIATSGSTDGTVILRAMRAGACEFLTEPLRIEELVGALDRVNQQRSGGVHGGSKSSMIIAVAGATGGVGTTSIAVNTGCHLAQDPSRTVSLVDLDLCLGDADVFLDTIPDYTIVDVAENVTRLDFTLLKRSLTKHSSGLFLLPRPVNLDETNLVTPDDLQRVIGLLKATFSHLILDLSKSYSALDRVAMSMADQILLVTQLDLPCLRNVVRLLNSFNDVEGLSEKVKIVVNRAGLNEGGISLKKAQDTIGRDIFWQIPNDYSAMVASRNNGVPLIEQAPKASITQSMGMLADSLVGKETVAAEASGAKLTLSRLLGAFGGKKTAPAASEIAE